MPERIQMQRTKGWRMPENTVKVDRTTKWGNPFVVGQQYAVEGDDEPATVESTEEAVILFRDWVESGPWYGCEFDPTELRGKNLACWCKPGDPCHADVLLELANTNPEQNVPLLEVGTDQNVPPTGKGQ